MKTFDKISIVTFASTGLFWFCTSHPNSIKEKDENEFLYFIPNKIDNAIEDSLFKFNIHTNQKEFISIVPKNIHNPPSINQNYLLYCKVEGENRDNPDNYKMYIYNLKTKEEKLIRGAYGGRWNKKGDKFIAFKDDSLWLYSFPDIKVLATYGHGQGWRFSGVDWSSKDDKILIHIYSRDSAGKSELLIFDTGLNVSNKVVTKGIVATKDIVNINDTLVIFPADCFQHFTSEEKDCCFHLVSVDVVTQKYKCLLNASQPASREAIEFRPKLHSVVYSAKNKGLILWNIQTGEEKTIPLKDVMLCN